MTDNREFRALGEIITALMPFERSAQERILRYLWDKITDSPGHPAERELSIARPKRQVEKEKLKVKGMR